MRSTQRFQEEMWRNFDYPRPRKKKKVTNKMNQRINELAEQAFQPINDISTEGVADRYTFEQTWFQMYNQKFAELIVRRCINIACEYDKPKLSGPGLAIASNIESHFDIYIEEDGRFVK